MSTESSRRATFAALFDWDGVIVDSRALHESAWNAVAHEFGYPHTARDFERHFGSRNQRAIRDVLKWTNDASEMERIAERKEQLYRERLRETDDVLLPGSVEFVRCVRELGASCAVVSSAPRENIEVVFERFAIRDLFLAVVTAEDVERGKPAPDCFLLGARKVDVAPERAVVFEDAKVGIEAARAAGMRAVALTSTHGAEALAAADVVVERLDSNVASTVARWFAAPVA